MSGRLAIVGGHSLLGSAFASEADPVVVDGGGGSSVQWFDAGAFVFLQRHGVDHYRPPHRIDHIANLCSARALGCDRVLAIGSVGSLRSDLEPGAMVSPSDFIALDQRVSAFDDERGHQVPAFDAGWRASVIDTWRGVSGRDVAQPCVYWQTTGPRFETPAEVRFAATFADVVGMTIASECVVAGELGLRYAAVCVVDNFANGVGDELLSTDAFEAGKAANRSSTVDTLNSVARALAR